MTSLEVNHLLRIPFLELKNDAKFRRFIYHTFHIPISSLRCKLVASCNLLTRLPIAFEKLQLTVRLDILQPIELLTT